jgi:hypothetical protein
MVPRKIQNCTLKNLIKLPDVRPNARLPALHFCDKFIKQIKA